MFLLSFTYVTMAQKRGPDEEKSDETEFLYTAKMVSQENSEGNALVRNKWMTMLWIIHYVLINNHFFYKHN